MPTKDATTKKWTGNVQKVGFPRKVKKGFTTKTEAKKWEDFIKSEMINKKDKWKIISPNGKDRYDFLSEKYAEFLLNPYNTLPDLIDLFFSDFNLDYSFKDVKPIVLMRKRVKIPANLRTKILKRDSFKCVLCGATMDTTTLHVDHIVPVDRGGVTEERNLRTLCKGCNWGKSNKPYSVTG